MKTQTTELQKFQLVRFGHERNGGPVHRIVSVMADGMVELHDMGGYFAPHLFAIADDVAAIPPDPQTTKSLTLSLTWENNRSSDDATLRLGHLLDIGDIMFMPKAGVWCAIGSTITNHRSTGHADKASAMAALEQAVKELEDGK